MSEVFITKIHINKVRHLENFEIPLSEDSKKHLILTGKNGSGKTSVLEEIRKLLLLFQNKQFPNVKKNKERFFAVLQQQKNTKMQLNQKAHDKKNLKSLLSTQEEAQKSIEKYLNTVGLGIDTGVDIDINSDHSILQNMFEQGKYITAYLGVKRPVANLLQPSGIQKVQFKDWYGAEEDIGQNFHQHIVNLKAIASFARDKGDIEKAKQISKWFEKFESSLAEVFDDKSLKLDFDIENFNFSIIQQGKEVFGLNEMSDGYSSFLKILMELIMRMENHKTKSYDLQGVVLIDEIETHLHVDLQKRVLPFLTKFFPNIQFIVTTHSPFVLSSIKDSVICDLENRTVSEDFHNCSYSSIVKAYFGADEYSQILKDNIARYKTLKDLKELSDDEEDEFLDLEDYLENLPKFLAPELEFEVNRLLEDK